MPGVCYSALRRLPRRDLHPLETNSVKQTMRCLLLHDAPRDESMSTDGRRPFRTLRPSPRWSGARDDARAGRRDHLQREAQRSRPRQIPGLRSSRPEDRRWAANTCAMPRRYRHSYPGCRFDSGGLLSPDPDGTLQSAVWCSIHAAVSDKMGTEPTSITPGGRPFCTFDKPVALRVMPVIAAPGPVTDSSLCTVTFPQ